MGEKPCSTFIIFLHLDNTFQLCSPAKLSSLRPMAHCYAQWKKCIDFNVFSLWNILACSKQWTVFTKSKKYILKEYGTVNVYFLSCRATEQKNIFIWEITTSNNSNLMPQKTGIKTSSSSFLSYPPIHFDYATFVNHISLLPPHIWNEV